MKQKDIALIVVIIIVSATISIVVSKKIFVTPQNRQQEVEVVQAITSDFKEVDKHYFNDQSFDPTRTISIGDNTNPDPFSKKQ